MNATLAAPESACRHIDVAGLLAPVRRRLKVRFVEAARYSEADLRSRLGLDGCSAAAAGKYSWEFRSRHGIECLPGTGRWFDRAKVEAALRQDAS